MNESKYDAIVSAALLFGRPVTAGEIQSRVRAKDETVRKHLRTAVERGSLIRHGTNRYVGYRYSAPTTGEKTDG